MGITFARLKLSNLGDPKKEVEEQFLIDSGANFTVVPENLVSKLKLKPKRSEKFELADGKVITRKVSDCLVEFEGIKVPTPVVMGEKDDSAILGALTLEAMGLTLDPLARKLYKATLRI